MLQTHATTNIQWSVHCIANCYTLAAEYHCSTAMGSTCDWHYTCDPNMETRWTAPSIDDNAWVNYILFQVPNEIPQSHMLAMVHYCYLVAAVPHRHYQNTQKSWNPLVLNNLWRYLVIGYKYYVVYSIYDGESPLRSLSSSLKQMMYISKPPNFPCSLVRK